MAVPRLKFNEFCRILRHYGVEMDASRGKGGHVFFVKRLADGSKMGYAMPGRRDVLPCYVSGARHRFGLAVADGVTDEDFYSHA